MFVFTGNVVLLQRVINKIVDFDENFIQLILLFIFLLLL